MKDLSWKFLCFAKPFSQDVPNFVTNEKELTI